MLSYFSLCVNLDFFASTLYWGCHSHCEASLMLPSWCICLCICFWFSTHSSSSYPASRSKSSFLLESHCICLLSLAGSYVCCSFHAQKLTVLLIRHKLDAADICNAKIIWLFLSNHVLYIRIVNTIPLSFLIHRHHSSLMYMSYLSLQSPFSL